MAKKRVIVDRWGRDIYEVKEENGFCRIYHLDGTGPFSSKDEVGKTSDFSDALEFIEEHSGADIKRVEDC